MFEVKNLTISIQDRYIIKDLSFTLHKNDKLAIIGEEGNGKTTLLKSLLGICDYITISGTISSKNNKIGYLEQTISNKDLLKTGYQFLFQNEVDYYNKINDLYKYLDILSLQDDLLKQVLSTLSGGERVKIRLLKLLLEENDILFFDEPTNDLDIKTLKWLEEFIQNTKKPILYVSHDELLLSNTANRILHLEQIKNKTDCRHTLVSYDYDTYIANRFRRIQKQNQLATFEKREWKKKTDKLNQIMQKVEHRQNVISRSDPHGAKVLKKKMKTLKTQEQKLENKNLIEPFDIEENIHFFFEKVEMPSLKKIINLTIKELTIEKRLLFQNIQLEIVGNSHVGIIGKNGVGKSTLLKEIKKELENRKDIKIGYMPQDYEDILKDYEYVFDFLSSTKEKEEITKIRAYLGNMNFTKEEMTCKIRYLSNGTKAKLFLIKFVLEKCNVLLLDEPTRNVSPLSNPIIRKVLKEFQGTIISVSHDRKYLKEVIDTIYVLTPNGLIKKNFTEF